MKNRKRRHQQLKTEDASYFSGILDLECENKKYWNKIKNIRSGLCRQELNVIFVMKYFGKALCIAEVWGKRERITEMIKPNNNIDVFEIKLDMQWRMEA